MKNNPVGRKPRKRHPGRARAKTPTKRALAMAVKKDRAKFGKLPPHPRPRTRGECIDGPRPCPYVGCRHHLYLEVVEKSKLLKFTFPDLEPWELAETCSLDIADSGSQTLEQIGAPFNITRERVRQLEEKALVRLKQRLAASRVRFLDFIPEVVTYARSVGHPKHEKGVF